MEALSATIDSNNSMPSAIIEASMPWNQDAIQFPVFWVNEIILYYLPAWVNNNILPHHARRNAQQSATTCGRVLLH